MEPSEFRGRIGRYHWESEPWWPDPLRPPEGAPNVLVVLLDDVGFAQLGCFGSDIDTPNLDRLAAGGLRYSNFHTTALCSPTRACLLTGRNHHRAGMGRIVDLATGFPGYDARIPRSCALAPAMLTPHGYAAWAVGKWHLTPEDEQHLGASRERWPLGRGFERFYGFFPGETHQFVPALVHDSHFVEPPAGIDDGYHLTTDLVDRAIEFVEDLRHVDADKPWFCYLAPGACHSPHQSPPEWLERYRGRFEQGWDRWREATLERQKALGVLPGHTELSPRPEWVPAWDSLSTQERRVYARYMEAFAAFLSHTDHELGRLLDRLEQLGELEDTIVVAMSDNGASSEGGPTGSVNDVRAWNALPRTVEEADERLEEIGGPRLHNNYPWGWTVAGNTPFRRWKRETHEGGVADPLIVHWPAGIAARGEVRHQYVHAIDVLPTLLDVIGVDPPEVVDGVPQQPLDGVSFRSTFDDPDAPEVRTTQYYEMFGCRGL
ncbi:MAG TPA: arylsulfatase, partial [Microthrixaceae bacterium]|nr:arylsulfatase [Microthrixaceae bacterium]